MKTLKNKTGKKINREHSPKKRIKFRKILAPSIIAAATVAILALFFTTTLSGGGLVLFASVAATTSAMCYHPKSKSNSLRTIMLSYLIALIISITMWYTLNNFNLSLVWLSFIAVFAVVMAFFLFDIFHAPAVSSVMGFLLYDKIFFNLLAFVIALFALFVVIKMMWYLYSEELKAEHFVTEFTKEHYGKR